MPIASYKPGAEPAPAPALPKTQPANYKSVIYDDNNVPLTSLISFVQGAPYYCDYYRQVVSEHNDLREVDPGQPLVFQQYEKINGLEIRVESPLSTSYDQDTGLTSVSGNGYIYPFMVPNVFDYFVSDAGDNRKALFKITSVERRTFNRDSVYFVTYDIVNYIEDVGSLYETISQRVIREYYFSKDRLIENLQPLLKTDDYNKLTELKYQYKELIRFYFNFFYNKRFSTLVVPGQSSVIYDKYIVDYVLKLIDYDDILYTQNIKTFSIDNDPYSEQLQFWDLMLEKQFSRLQHCNKDMALVNTKTFGTNSFVRGLFFTLLDYVVYPSNPNTVPNSGSPYDPKLVSDIEIQPVDTLLGTIADLINNTYTYGNSTYQIYYPVTKDNGYVLSYEFYNQTNAMSLLEILVKDYLKNQTIDLNALAALVTKYYDIGVLEQFYYGPILMTLIKEVQRSNYT